MSTFLVRRLASYSLAGATGAALFVSDARAAVIYTSVRQIGEGDVEVTAVLPIDLNQDGITDFNVVGLELAGFSTFAAFHTDIVYVNGFGGSVATGGAGTFRPLAGALRVGQKVGPGLEFQVPSPFGFSLALLFSATNGAGFHGGDFYNQRNKFLGLKLPLNGHVYYGWARVNVKAVNKHLVFELVDYAYQDRPGIPIRAGEGIPKPEADSLSPGMDSASSAAGTPQAISGVPAGTPFPAALGMLAYGSDAIPAWRR